MKNIVDKRPQKDLSSSEQACLRMRNRVGHSLSVYFHISDLMSSVVKRDPKEGKMAIMHVVLLFVPVLLRK